MSIFSKFARFGCRGVVASNSGMDSRSFNARIEIKRWTNNQQWMLKRQEKDDVLTGYPWIIALGQFPDRGEFPFSLGFLLIIADKPIVRKRVGPIRGFELGDK